MLDAHRDLAIIHEARFVADWFEHRRGVTPAGEVTAELIDDLLEYRPFQRIDVGREELERLAPPGRPVAYSRFVSGIFDLHGAASGKRLVGDKTPAHVRKLPTLHALWPHVRFVHLIRDGRDVCLSVRNWKKVMIRGGSVARYSTWEDDPVVTAALWWEWQVRLGREAGATLDPALYREIRYEALVSDPGRECRALCDFLELPYDERMLAFHEGRRRADPGLSAKTAWLPVTRGLRNWRTEMSAGDVERFEAAAGALLDELGYRRAMPVPGADAMRRASLARRSFSLDVERRAGRRLPERWTG
jgi:hypothetical protein